MASPHFKGGLVMNSQDYMEKESQYVMDTYARFPVVLEKGNGATVFDVDGKKYIDFGSGIGVNSLGYGDKGIAKAVAVQAKKLAHISNLYYHPEMIELAEMLVNASKMDKVFFANSGAEANEGAIKLARKYSFDKYGEGRSNIITLVNSFHGRTVTTLSATGQDSFHQFFFPFTEGFIYAEANNSKSVLSRLNNSVCAVMLEVIQGEGGVLPLQKRFLKELEAACRQKDILLIVDEIQTGVGRTGAFLASEHFDISPDIVTLAKGLAGGLPIGAVLCNEKLSKVFGKGHHGSTFGANPVSCAAAVEVLKRIDKGSFYKKVLRRAKYIRAGLKEIPQVSNIRGMGLMLGFDLKDNLDAKKVVTLLAEKGLLALTAKTSVRFLPPLIISYQEIDEGLEILKNVLEECSQ